MKRRLSNLALSALTIAAVSGLTVLRTGLAADAAWRQDYTPLTVNTYPVSESFTGISVTDYYADVQLRVSRDGSPPSASGCSTMRTTTPRSPSICPPATTGP